MSPSVLCANAAHLFCVGAREFHPQCDCACHTLDWGCDLLVLAEPPRWDRTGTGSGHGYHDRRGAA